LVMSTIAWALAAPTVASIIAAPHAAIRTEFIIVSLLG
jgi:hypothetical protein